MTNIDGFWRLVEQELLNKRAVNKSTCEAFSGLHPGRRSAYAKAMSFLGCEVEEIPPQHADAVLETDRIRASRLMLLKLYLDTGEPRWSSWILERLLEAVVTRHTEAGNDDGTTQVWEVVSGRERVRFTGPKS